MSAASAAAAARNPARPARSPLRAGSQAGEQRRTRPSDQARSASPANADEQAQMQPEDAAASCTYNAERVIGNGTFGIVYRAQLVETDETVAIKKVFVDRRYRNRELQLLREIGTQEMRHPNIVALRHAFYTSGDSPDELFLNMVMEYVPETVYCVMKRYTKASQPMPKLLVKLYSYQALRALAHLHASGICHRDIKPQNLLVDVNARHILKLCDFGSATRIGQSKPTLVAYICSRYYRAPELIFGATNYTTAIDLWSIGCVIAEMLRGRPLFPGENGVDQLVEIVKILGTPDQHQVIAMNPQYYNFSSPKIEARDLSGIFRKDVGANALLLLGALLQYDPEARVRPLEACAHRFFDVLREENTRIAEGGAAQPLPDLFNLTRSETRVLLPSVRERLIPSWYTKLQGAA